MSKQEAFCIVFDELVKISTFRGIYDAENGSKEFMHGVASVMECIAYNINADMASAFSASFLNNMYDCIEEVEK